MSIDPIHHKIHTGVASHALMFELLNLRVDASPEDRYCGAAWAGRWFEIEQASYDEMRERLPPRFMGDGMFAFGELKAGTVGSVFLEIAIAGQRRWFHGYCDVADRTAPAAMRAAILFWEIGDASGMTREQKLDAIWVFTPDASRGFTGVASESWPQRHRSDRTILVHEPGVGTVVKFLDALTDDEITQRLPHRPA